jgi:hydrogenase maturation protease
MTEQESARVLIIGYGNSLRSDDAAGIKVAETIATWQLPHVRSLAVHQLTPELAAELAAVELVIFVDACVFNHHDLANHSSSGDPEHPDRSSNSEAGRSIADQNDPTTQHLSTMLDSAIVQVIPLAAIANNEINSHLGATVGHVADPLGLLALSKLVYGRLPIAWQILIPALNFEFGDRLSPLTQQGVNQALAQVKMLINQHLTASFAANC